LSGRISTLIGAITSLSSRSSSFRIFALFSAEGMYLAPIQFDTEHGETPSSCAAQDTVRSLPTIAAHNSSTRASGPRCPGAGPSPPSGGAGSARVAGRLAAGLARRHNHDRQTDSVRRGVGRRKLKRGNRPVGSKPAVETVAFKLRSAAYRRKTRGGRAVFPLRSDRMGHRHWREA